MMRASRLLAARPARSALPTKMLRASSSCTRDKLLFTPGPLTTTASVKQTMLRDFGSRDQAFVDIVRDIRARLVAVGDGVGEYETVLMQGSGTFSVETVVGCMMPKENPGKLLVINNGAYGARIAKMCEVLGVSTHVLDVPIEGDTPDLDEVEALLSGEQGITHLAMVHCETSTGVFNPIEKVGQLCKQNDVKYFIDAMSSFGAVPLSLRECNADFLVSSANKCIEGVPGFGFILAKKSSLDECKGNARSLAFDMYAQWEGLEKDGQFRFTPPTHALLAYQQALIEHEAEGGVVARSERYQENCRVLLAGMKDLGFKQYVRCTPEEVGYIISTFEYPTFDGFSFETFYSELSDRGFVIYPGKVTEAEVFRVGNIGQLFPADIHNLLNAMNSVLDEMR